MNEFAQAYFIDETANFILILKLIVEFYAHYTPKMKTKAFAEIQI